MERLLRARTKEVEMEFKQFGIGTKVCLNSNRNRYEMRARVGWRGVIEKIDPLDKCALVRWSADFKEWIELRILTV